MANVKFSALPTASALAATDIFCVSQPASGGTSKQATVSQLIDNTAYTSAWSGLTAISASKNAIYTQLHKIDTADDGTIINAGTGFRIGGAAASGKILIGNATNFVASTPTYPNASATARKFIVSDGTNWVASTETQDAPGATGNILISDGANWKSKPGILSNASIVAQASQFASNTYLAGSGITVAAGAWTQGTQYWCMFDMSKTGAGTTAFQINVHIGTLGTTGDTAVINVTSGTAQTAVAETVIFEVFLNFRSVGSGTSAVVVATWRMTRLTVLLLALLTLRFLV